MTLVRALDAIICEVLQIVNALLLAVMFFVVISAVIARYIFGMPIFWADEFARYAMFYLVLIGSSLALRADEHPRLMILVDRLSPLRKKIWLRILDYGVVALALIFLVEGTLMALDEAIMKSPALRISYFWIYLAFPIGAVLLLLQVAFKYLNVDRGTINNEP